MTITGGILAALPWWGVPGPVLLIAFVPLLLVEESLQGEGEPVISLIPLSFTFFFCWNFLATWWIARIHILGGMSVIVLNAVFMSLVFLLYAYIKRGTGRGPLIFVILWSGFEFLHHSGDLSWPWLTLGNGLAASISLIQWYEYTGAAGGTLWVLLVNALIFSVIRQFGRNGEFKARVLRVLLLLLLAAVPPAASIFIFNSFGEKEGDVEFLIIQPGLDPYREKYDGTSNSEKLERLLSLAKENMRDGVTYVLFPETSVDSVWITDPGDRIMAGINGFACRYPGTGLVLGATTFSHVNAGDRSFTTRQDGQGNLFEVQNSALLVYPGFHHSIYHKHYLANGVEQIPFQKFLDFLGKLSIDMGGVSGSMRRGPGAMVFRSPLADSLVKGILICFESAYGEYAARMVRKGAEMLIVISNDGWFRDTGAYRQHLRMSQIRAVETRRSIIRAANTGISCHISPTGEIGERTGWFEEGTLLTRAGRSNDITFYAAYGDYAGRTALFFSILLILDLLVRISRSGLRDGSGFRF